MYLSAAYFIWIRHNTTAYHLGRYSLHLLLLKSSMAQRNRQRLPSCGPGFESQAQHLRFLNL